MSKIKNRNDILTEELINYNPKKNGFNIPTKDYTVRLEDIIPALSGTIGKIALVAAFAIAWAKAYNISNEAFVTENVRMELIVGSIITIIFSAILNPYAAPPGTLAPLIPLIPLMASLGVHPLVLGISIGVLGLIIARFKFFDKIMELNGVAARGGIILLFGIMGIMSSVDSLSQWTSTKNNSILIILIMLGVIAYLVLNKMNLKWLMIPVAAAIGLLIPAFYGIYPEVKAVPAFPILNPKVWWVDIWGLGFGFTVINFVKALPFALLAVVMWPTDGIAIKTLQESNYGPKAKKSIFHMNSTFAFASIRNIIGCFLGGAQTAAVWRSFMIPLSIVKRPIGGSAFLLGISGIVFALLGFPIDIAIFPPLIGLVLLFGVYIPLVEIGLNTLKTSAQKQIAAISLLTGLAINPVIGWVTAIVIENFNIIKEDNMKTELSSGDLKITVIVAIVATLTYLISISI
ncbi:DUF3360 domain-containing protein [Clostridium sp. MSJ-11]|uniref:DUF3360 domain-containing protein n=1 Tax=Clostridium mobile TaxID=2841512 RepID=A0ABS6EH89_9CLOT|nr:DUF3360 family protein [Clostridium mobile]MBU5484574.1 DUF3360 domain-containing protein [Clostridium mobile]